MAMNNFVFGSQDPLLYQTMGSTMQRQVPTEVDIRQQLDNALAQYQQAQQSLMTKQAPTQPEKVQKDHLGELDEMIQELDNEIFARRITGIMLVALSVCIVGVNILSALRERGTAFHEIIMIAIATYTFIKITVAIVGMVKARHAASAVLKTLRNIALADACVSIYTMQRSMLQSFPGLTPAEIQIFNILTGTAVWIVVLFLGINLIGGKRVDMAKSKIVEANKKIAEAVTDGYKKIEQGVVSGYKKIERGVVSGYTKIEDKFVDAYLTKDGETVEEAKARLKKENK